MIKKIIFPVLFILIFLFNAIGEPSKPFFQSDKKPDYVFEMIDPLYRETVVSKLISIKNENDITEKRNKLIQYIWKGRGFPYSKMPSSIEKDIKDKEYNDMENLEKIDKLTVSMEYGFKSIVYLFHPIHNKNRLILYHQGHSDLLGKEAIQFFLNKGYTVLGYLMPLKGINVKPIVELPLFGKIKMIEHNYMELMKSDSFSPIKLFMEPIAVALNYALKEYGFSPVYMTGISGGGWSTTLYSALDTRILKSYPVAGTLPIYMRIKRDWGDYEQIEPEMYRIANYLELYILGSYGDSRKQFQMLNKYDSCCFAGIKYRLYEEEVKNAVSHLGKGAFDIFLDDSHKEHKISNIVLNIIYNDIESQK